MGFAKNGQEVHAEDASWSTVSRSALVDLSAQSSEGHHCL